MWGLIARAAVDQPFRARRISSVLPRVEYLPAEAQRRWLYFKLWPNVAFDIYPDQVDFMQFLPVSPTETMIREISYALPDERREMKAARYLELAHQPARQRRGHGADHPRAAGHGVVKLYARARSAKARSACAAFAGSCAR